MPDADRQGRRRCNGQGGRWSSNGKRKRRVVLGSSHHTRHIAPRSGEGASSLSLGDSQCLLIHFCSYQWTITQYVTVTTIVPAHTPDDRSWNSSARRLGVNPSAEPLSFSAAEVVLIKSQWVEFAKVGERTDCITFGSGSSVPTWVSLVERSALKLRLYETGLVQLTEMEEVGLVIAAGSDLNETWQDAVHLTDVVNATDIGVRSLPGVTDLTVEGSESRSIIL